MAKADGKSSPVTWITLSVARDLAIPVIHSPRYAEPQIVKWLHLKRIRWRYVNVYGLAEEGRSLEQEAKELWATRPSKVLVEWEESFACKPTRFHYRPGRDIRPLGHITVIGIEIVREDLERTLETLERGEVAPISSPPAPKPKPLRGTKKRVYELLKHHPEANAGWIWEQRPAGAEDEVDKKTVQNLVPIVRKLLSRL
jgi:hypothetical protein